MNNSDPITHLPGILVYPEYYLDLPIGVFFRVVSLRVLL